MMTLMRASAFKTYRGKAAASLRNREGHAPSWPIARQSRRSATLHRALFLVIGLWAGCGSDAPTQNPPAPQQELAPLEYKVKAGFLYNFAKLTQWPSNSFTTAEAPLTIGVLGDDAFSAVLDDVLRSKTVENRKIVVQRLKHADEIDGCHVLFISVSERDRLRPLFATLADRSILTVSDLPGFAEAGGMIEIVRQGPRKLRVNLPSAERAQLRLSSRLLALADVAAPRAEGR